MNTTTKKKTTKVFTLRIDAELLEQLSNEARTQKRSTAKHLEYLIEKHFNEN